MNSFLYNTRHDINEDNFTDVTQQKRISVFSKWELQRKSKLPFLFAARYFAENRWGGELQWSPQWRGSDSIYGESIITSRVEAFGRYGFRAAKQDFLLEYSYNFHDQDAAYGNKLYLATQHTAFAQVRWNKKLGSHDITAGVPVRYTQYDDNTPATMNSSGKNQPDKVLIAGGFVQDEWELSDKLTTLIGLRYEYNDAHGGIAAPRLSFKYAPDNRHTFRLSSGNGFRVVNLFTEDHLALSGARDLLVLNTLKPERSWNLNFNYAAQFPFSNGFAGGDISLFYTHFTNRIIADYDSDPQLIIYDNLDGYAVSRGLSLNADLNIAHRLKFLTGFTWMDVFQKNGKLAEKERILFAPDFSSSYSLSYSFPSIRLIIDLTGKTYGAMKLPVVPNDYRPEYSPWFTLLNLQLSKKIGQYIEVYGGLKNLLNFIPEDPILRPFDPFDKNVDDPVNNPHGYTFDPTYNYAPVQGIKGFFGIRMKI
jgi:outer membrane receptor for ferrienterochelin and colicins